MYKLISKKFAKDIGGTDNDVQPISSVNEAHKVKVMKMVIKKVKKRYIVWTKDVYRAINYDLDSLLLDSNKFKLDVPHSKEFVCKWNWQSTSAMKGKGGANILKGIVDANLTAENDVSVHADLGEVSIVEIEKKDLETQLSGRQLNLTSPIIQQIQHNKKTVLCVVQAIYMTEKDAEIKRVDKKGASVNVYVPVNSAVNGTIGGSVEVNNMKNMVLAKNTPFAYKVLELQVDKDSGSVVIANPPLPSFTTIDATAHQTSLEEDDSRSNSLAESNLTFTQLKSYLCTLSKLPGDERDLVSLSLAVIPLSDVKQLEYHMDTAEDRLDSASVGGMSKVLEAKFTNQNECYSILNMAGFQQQNYDVWLYPTQMSPMFEALNYILGAVAELPDFIFNLTRNVSEQVALAVVDIIGSTLGNEPLLPLDALNIVQEDPSCIQLLDMLGYPTDGYLLKPAYAQQEINKLSENVYWLLCTLHNK